MPKLLGTVSQPIVDAGNSSTAKTLDWTLTNKYKLTLTGNCTLTFTAPDDGANLYLKLIQDGTGTRLVTWPSAVKWPASTAPTLSTAIAAYDIVTLVYDAVAGVYDAQCAKGFG